MQQLFRMQPDVQRHHGDAERSAGGVGLDIFRPGLAEHRDARSPPQSEAGQRIGETPGAIAQFGIAEGTGFGGDGDAIGEHGKGPAEHAVDRRTGTGGGLACRDHGRGIGVMALRHHLRSSLLLCRDGKSTWARTHSSGSVVNNSG